MSVIETMKAQLQEIAGLPDQSTRSLAGRFYTDPDFFRYEVETILKHEWFCLGRADEIPRVGDYFTTSLFEEPLLVTRGDDGAVRVLSNVCRHRNMLLVEGSGNTRLFACPYHAWTYDRAGVLVTAPRMKEKGVTPGSCRLPEFKSEVWNGFIYANLDDDAPPLGDRLGQLETLLSRYDTEAMRFVGAFEEIWHTNWKCLVENFMEAYHLSVVHPETIHPYSPTSLSRKSLADDAFTSYSGNYPDSAATRGQGAPGLTDAERRRSTLFAIFPTQVASQAATLLASYTIQPLTVDSIRVRWTLSTYGDQLTSEELKSRIALWQEINREDRVKLEKMQQALSSRHAVSGPLAPADFEGTITDFHRYLARRIGPSDASRPRLAAV